MDYVPSLDLISSFFTPDLIEQDGFGFEFPDPTSVPSKLISFRNSDISDRNTDSKDDRKRKGDEISGREVEGSDERLKKRMRHRDVERQRRQEVSSLFKNLRSLLPLQYVKGKRSSSDLVSEAVDYIKDLQKRIKEFDEKKDQIKKISDGENRASGSAAPSSTEACSSSPSSSSSSCSCGGEGKDIEVVIMPCLGGGVEIVISCCFRHEFCLSSVLQVLVEEEGFNVFRCTSATLQSSRRLLHNIFAQVDGGRNINFAELQDKIMRTRR
ncbi:PREDICTED: transcription factor bHLH125 [Tarenaya hassleriana]|uniref:transcription factor bHLH125 n=1 Tax=Tarenaya hassleriana TaxID=28532 RepID=UPI00053C82EC|nr:PREDICTED: transcription factor bHLH125 [Tarenaya hassleriana]